MIWQGFNYFFVLEFQKSSTILVSIIASLTKVVRRRGERSNSSPSTEFSIGPSEINPGKWCITTKPTRALRSNLVLNQRVSTIISLFNCLLCSFQHKAKIWKIQYLYCNGPNLSSSIWLHLIFCMYYVFLQKIRLIFNSSYICCTS